MRGGLAVLAAYNINKRYRQCRLLQIADSSALSRDLEAKCIFVGAATIKDSQGCLLVAEGLQDCNPAKSHGTTNFL